MGGLAVKRTGCRSERTGCRSERTGCRSERSGCRSERSGLHVGLGGGLWGWTTEDGSHEYVLHLLGLEALASKSLTERLSIRFGASLVLPLHVHPTVLLAWEL